MLTSVRLHAEPNGAQPKFSDACVHRLFERQAANSPDAVAVVCGDRRLTYRQLNEGANRLARRLRRYRPGSEELVGVGLGRSASMIVALLAAWKAGCAYVPLDPAYPADRLAFMARDAGLRLLLTDERAAPSFAGIGGGAIELLNLDAEAASLDNEIADDLDFGAAADLAYVMYTSGSTGQPKGAMITHAGLANYLCWAVDAYRIEAGGSVPVHSSLSFDLTVTSLYAPLLAGAHIELLAEEGGAQALAAALRATKRSLVKLTPAHLELLAHQLAVDELANATDVFVIGGENLLAERLAVWRARAPATRLINEYGPTETVVGCCTYEVTPADPASGSIPIGRPIANMRLHVLDAQLQPVAAGAVGELYIGGPGVARGYLNRPELTRERFVADPCSGEPGARLYKTGDMARCRADGVLEYLGRYDDQVKIRGYRIELGEVEQALGGHPDVRLCAAVAHEDEAGDQRLVAFAVPRGGVSLTADGLVAFMRGRLPMHMLPERFALLDAMPLNLNGKVDRAALKTLADAVLTRASDAPAALCMAPRTPTETMVAEAFRDAFRREDIGIFDSFFDVGGHSMMAVRLMAALRSATGVNLPLRNLYEHPTIAGLAEAIDALLWSSSSREIPERAREDDEARTRISF